MSWDAAWDDVFARQEWGRYPPEELVRFVARAFYSSPERRAVRILDAGCGPGSGIWYLAREGFDAWGVDGSSVAIDRARTRLREDALEATLVVGDLSRLDEIYEPASFDAVLDVTSVQHNPAAVIEAIHGQIHSLLRPDGRVFAMMVARGSWGDGLGAQTEPGTFLDITEGPLLGKGLTHFSDRADVERFFSVYETVTVDRSERTLQGGRHRYAHWVVEAART